MLPPQILYRLMRLRKDAYGGIIREGFERLLPLVDIPLSDPYSNPLILKQLQLLSDRYTSSEDQNYCETLHYIEEYIWEELHSVYWKAIPTYQRDAYSFITFLSALNLAMITDDIQQAIRKADTGILMGSDFFKPHLQTLIRDLHPLVEKDLSSSSSTTQPYGKRRRVSSSYHHIVLAPLHGPLHSVIARSCEFLSLGGFVLRHLDRDDPVVLEGLMAHWNAMQDTTWCQLTYFESKHGHRLVPVEVGASYLSDSSSQKLMTISEFTTALEGDQSSIVYLAQHCLFDQIPELMQDIDIPEYCYCLPTSESLLTSIHDETDVVTQIWFGPIGTYSPLHHDPYHNLLAQVVGFKYVRLYAESESKYLYAMHQTLNMSNNSSIDFSNENYEDLFPLLKNASYTETILCPGDMLYVPRWCWHLIISIDEATATTWKSKLGDASPDIPTYLSTASDHHMHHVISISFWWGERKEK